MCGIDIETELKRHASSYRHRPWEDEFPDELRARVPMVSIIIPVNNGLEFTKPCLESIHANTPPAFELVVVDNASDDGTAEYLDGLDGIVIRNPINVGFPHSINQGLERARGKYVCLLNNDTEVLPGWLEPLIEDARDQDVACAGPLQTDGDGKVWHFGTVFYPEGHQFPRRPRHLKLGYPPDLASPLAKREFPAMNFACCLSRKEVFDEVGPLDAERYSFPGYYEDVDWMLRARELGYRAVFDPRSEIVHYGSKGVGDPDLKLKSEAARKRNVLRFVERWRDAPPVLFQVADPTCELEGKDIATIKVREDGQPIDIPLLLKRKHAELETEKKLLAEARDSRLDEPGDPLVSVIIPTFNKAELLVERSIPSVLAQTYKRIEVVVVGDHCEDDTAERVAALNDDRVTFVNLPERGRYPATAVERLASSLPLDVLERALNEPAQEVLSSAAASALSSRGEDGARVLLAAVETARGRNARIAARELARMGGVASRAAMEAGASTVCMGPERELLAAAGMARARACESLGEALRPLLPSPSPLLTAAAVELLSECGPPATDSLEFAAKSCAHARERAARALVDINTPDSAYALRYLVQYEYLPVRLSTACALGTRGHELALEALEDILENGDVPSKCRAAKALAGIADRRGFDLLSDASRDPDARVRHAARRSLASTWPARCPDLLDLELVLVRPDRPHRFKLLKEELALEVGRLSSENPAVRLAAVRNLGAIGDSGAAAPLADALLDPDDRVALEARVALDRLEV